MTGDAGGTRVARRQEQHRRRRVLVGTAIAAVVAMGVVALVVVVVTRTDDAGTASVSRDGTRTSSTTTSTTLPVSTTVVPASDDPVVALAQQYDGRYVGTFTNTTFATTGPAVLELRIDPATATMAVDVEFDGDLFGGGAQQVRRISGTVSLGGDPNATIATSTKAFGPVSGRIDETLALVLTADDVPDARVGSFVLTGRLRADRTGFDATYTVTFEDASTAEGTAVLTCDPEGNRASVVTTVCALGAPSA